MLFKVWVGYMYKGYDSRVVSGLGTNYYGLDELTRHPTANARPSADSNTNMDCNIFEYEKLIHFTALHLDIQPQDLKLQYYLCINEATLVRLARHGNRHVELLLRLHAITSVHYYGLVTVGDT